MGELRGGAGGATKWENCGSENCCAHPSRQGKTFCTPPPFFFKEWKQFVPPFSMAKLLQAPLFKRVSLVSRRYMRVVNGLYRGHIYF